jgi:hypothetical protein
VVLPPPIGPVLSALSVGQGPTASAVVIQWTCASPVAKTPLGPHLIAVRAKLPGNTTPAGVVFALDSTLDALGNAAPTSGSGVWIVSRKRGSP